MKFTRPIVLACLTAAILMSAGCDQSTPKDEKAAAPSESTDQGWQASTLSEDTIAKANAAVLDYRQCLAKQTGAKAFGEGDSRSIANEILKACEDRLGAIKTAFDAEQVPASISERYIRKTRSQGVQTVMLSVQSAQAQRAAAAEESKQ